MVDKFRDERKALSTANMGGIGNLKRGPYSLSDFMSDPFTLYAALVPDVEQTRYLDEVRINGHNSRTQLKVAPTWLDGLRLAYQVLTQNSAPVKHGTAGWTPRISVATGGSEYSGVSSYQQGTLQSLYSTTVNRVGEYGFDDFPFAKATLHGSRVIVDSKLLWYLMRDMFAQSSAIYFERNAAYGFHVTTLTLLGKTDSFIRYSVECNGYSLANHSIYYGTTECNVGFTFDKTLGRLFLRIDSGKIWYKHTTKAVIDTFVWNGDFRQVVKKVQPTIPGNRSSEVLSNPQWSISFLSRGLYHSQSKAVHSLIGDVSANFETLVESPGFVSEVLPFVDEFAPSLVRDISGKRPVSLDRAFLKRGSAKLGRVERFRNVLKLLIGGYFAYLFAIKPTLETAKDILTDHIAEISSLNSAKGVRFYGDATTLSVEYPSLRNLISSVSVAPVVYYDVRLRTQIYLKTRSDDIIEVLINILKPVMSLGVLPEPKMIWAAARFSFIVDEFLPISTLIEHAQDFFSSFRLSRCVIGHSALVKVWTSDGIVTELYIRSDETSDFIDPPADSWLRASGAQASILVPLACTLLL